MKRLICFILIVGIHTIYAPTPLSNADSKVRIRVEISNEDSSQRFLNAKVESYLKRELRKYSDVEIVVDSFDYVITGIAMEVTTDGGYVTGYIVTMNILKRQDLRLWKVNLGYDVFTFIRQQVAYNSDLESICRDFAVVVDSQVLEMERQIKRWSKETAERLKTKWDWK